MPPKITRRGRCRQRRRIPRPGHTVTASMSRGPGSPRSPSILERRGRGLPRPSRATPTSPATSTPRDTRVRFSLPTPAETLSLVVRRARLAVYARSTATAVRTDRCLACVRAPARPASRVDVRRARYGPYDGSVRGLRRRGRHLRCGVSRPSDALHPSKPRPDLDPVGGKMNGTPTQPLKRATIMTVRRIRLTTRSTLP